MELSFIQKFEDLSVTYPKYRPLAALEVCFFEQYFYLSDFHIINHIINLNRKPGTPSDAARKLFFSIFFMS